MVVLVMAASSGSVQVWVNPSPDGLIETDRSAPAASPAPVPDASGATVDVVRAGLFLNALAGVVVAILLVGAGVLALEQLRPGLSRRMFLRGRRSIPEIREATPDPRRRLLIDVDAAETALSIGSPRNAIVGCWMLLELDAARAGFERHVAETATEYVSRVITNSSVDSVPIGELAALYQEARFSRHDLTDDHGMRARSALDGVVASLREFEVAAT